MKHPKLTLATVLAAALLAAGCSGESEEKLIASAQGYLAQRDTKAAVIQLKNALQKNPESATARLLLGRALLDSGDPRGAIEELRKAQSLRAPDDEVLPPMARAMVAIGESQKVVDQFAQKTLGTPAASADLLSSVAGAYSTLRDDAKAADYAARALQAQPGFPAAMVLQAQAKAVQGDFDGAIAQVDAVLKNEPTHHGAGTLKAILLWQGKRDRDGAITAYRAVTAAHPNSVAARSALVGLLREKGDVAGATAELAELKKVAPAHPETQYLEARAAFETRDYRKAQDLMASVLKAAPDNPSALELAGSAAFQLRAFQQAEAQLSRTLQLAPGRTAARRTLAQAQLRMGQPAKALETLAPILALPTADGATLALAGEAHLQAGDAAKADDAFRRAAKASPDDTQVRTTVAIAMAARGNVAEALPQLETLAAADSSPRADLALISARMAQRDYAGATKAIDALAKKLPDAPLPEFLRGNVLKAQGNAQAAAAAFEAALAKDPAHLPSAGALAAQDLAANKPEQARQRFAAVLKADPKAYAAHLALADIATRTQAGPEAVRRHLTDAVQAAPGEPRPRVQLVNQLLRDNDTKGALSAAQEGIAAQPDQPELLDALGRAQLAAGDTQQALGTFRKLAATQPQNGMLTVRLAEAQVAAKDLDGARASLRRALQIDPRLFAAQRGLATLAMAEKKPDDAVAVAREWQKAHPKEAAGFALEGEVQAARKDWPAAIGALRAASERQKTPEIALALHSALLNGGQKAEADRWAAEWQKANPKDAAFRFHLGDVALARGDLAVAEGHYRAVMEQQPGNPVPMNNVAWIMAKQGKPGAVKLAEQASQLRPDAATILDTLAFALAAEKQMPRALEVQKQAVAKAPKDHGLRLNLAKLYLQAGDKAQARGELETLAKLGDAYRGQAEVGELLKQAQ